VNHFTSSQIAELFGGNEGVQLVNRLVKLGICSKEYQIGGEWVKQPDGKVTAVRYDISPVRDSLEDISELFRYIKEQSIESPEKGDKVRERLGFSRFNNSELVLFSPWGPKYSGDSDLENETRTLQELRERLKKFREKNCRTNFLLMPADLYGAEINQLPSSSIEEYFKILSELTFEILGNSTNITITPWSQIRGKNYRRYQELRKQFDKEFNQKVKRGQYERALVVARIFNTSNPEDSARRYCIERLAEGCLIEEVYSPVKLSLVRKDKDILDGPLPRIYVIKNRAPWLGKENSE